jgi:hypothetical protein
MAGTPPNPHTRADRRLKENKGLPPYQVSDKPWSSVSQADYADAVDYVESCLIRLTDGKPESQWTKADGKLPVREPASMGGKLNRNACHAAAAVLAGGMGGVQASAEDRKAAARLLMRYYRNWLKEPVPASLKQLAQG